MKKHTRRKREQWQSQLLAITLDPKLTDTQRRILIFVLSEGSKYRWTSLGNEHGTTRQSLAMYLGLEYKAIQRALWGLENRGFIRWGRNEGREELVLTDKVIRSHMDWVKDARGLLGHRINLPWSDLVKLHDEVMGEVGATKKNGIWYEPEGLHHATLAKAWKTVTNRFKRAQ